MTNYEGARVKLTDNQLSKLKFAAKKQYLFMVFL